jgi:orotidine-5'-phosphate decarboxylase
MPRPFADRLAALVAERRSQVCLGLDPDPSKLSAEGAAQPAASAAERAGAAVAAHCRDLIECAGPACVAIKPQLACFERLGAPGWSALEETCAAAREAGLLVVADGKRGDVPVTAAAYGQALVGVTPTPWGEVPGLGADAFTANPLLGADALEPLVAAAENAGAGVFALVRTSNPGAADVQDLPGPDAPLHERLARLVDELGDRLLGEGGLSGMGAVVGATEPEHIGRLRELMPRAIFLLPGVGAQGGRPELLGAAFAAGPASALVPVSRGIAAAEDPAAAAEDLRARVWAVASE